MTYATDRAANKCPKHAKSLRPDQYIGANGCKACDKLHALDDLRALCPKHSGMAKPHTLAQPCKACDKLQAVEELRTLCPPGTTVYTILRSVSRSGMSRGITPFIVDTRGDPVNLTWQVAKVLGRPIRRAFQDSIRCDGAGMDMGHDLVHGLSYALHGHDASEIVRCHCKASDDPTADKFRPGYTLNHRWL